MTTSLQARSTLSSSTSSISRAPPERAAGAASILRPLRGVVVAAAAAGIVVALAPILPGSIRSPLVVAALAVWVAMAGVACVAVLRASWRDVRAHHEDRALAVIALIGTLIACVMAAQVEIIRVLERRPAFTWMLDWRWSLNHAQAIARSGNIFEALDYRGAGLDYHVGPAWLAASVERVFGGGLSHVLFGIVPLLCVVTMIIGGALVLRGAGLKGRLAAAAMVVAVAWPAPHMTPTWIVHGPREVLLSPWSWQFLATDMMLNSFLGYAVDLAGLALLLDRRATTFHLVVGSLALASCVQIKPQFFVGLGIVAGVVACWRLASERENRARAIRLCAAVLATLALAIAARLWLPGDVALFEPPRLVAPELGELAIDARRTYTLVALAALAAWLLLRRHRRASATGLPLDLLAAAAAASIGLALALRSVVTPLKSAYVAQGQALRLHDIYPTYLTADLLQGTDPGKLLLLAAAVGLLGATAMLVRRRAGALFAACCAIVVLFPIPILVAGFTAEPPAQYAVAEDDGLYEALRSIPVEGSILLSSDLADPANDYARPLRAPLLTAYQGHQFYLADLRYVHYVRPDAVERLTELRRFFGAPWSAWSDAWLASRGITHILVDARCSPVWLGDPNVPLLDVTQAGDWRVLEVKGQPASGVGGATAPPSQWRELIPKTGRADCLLGGQGN